MAGARVVTATDRNFSTIFVSVNGQVESNAVESDIYSHGCYKWQVTTMKNGKKDARTL